MRELNTWTRYCLFIHSTNIPLPPQHLHLSKRYVKLNMAKTKFLIFPEKLLYHSLCLHPYPHPISFDESCSFLVAQVKNHKCLNPRCLSVSCTPNPTTRKPCWLYPQNLTTSQLFHCCLSDPNHCHLLSILCQWPPNWSHASTLISSQAFLNIAAKESLSRSKIWPHHSYPSPPSSLQSTPKKPHCSLFIPAHTHLMALALADHDLDAPSAGSYIIHLLHVLP